MRFMTASQTHYRASERGKSTVRRARPLKIGAHARTGPRDRRLGHGSARPGPGRRRRGGGAGGFPAGPSDPAVAALLAGLALAASRPLVTGRGAGRWLLPSRPCSCWSSWGCGFPGSRALAGPPIAVLVIAAAVLALAAAPPRWSAAAFLPVVALVYGLAAARVQAQVGPQGDEPHYLMVADSLLRDRDLSLERDYADGRYRDFHPEPLAPHYRVRGREGAIYSLHAVGLSLLVLPAYAAASYARRVVLHGAPRRVAGLASCASPAAGGASARHGGQVGVDRRPEPAARALRGARSSRRSRPRWGRPGACGTAVDPGDSAHGASSPAPPRLPAVAQRPLRDPGRGPARLRARRAGRPLRMAAGLARCRRSPPRRAWPRTTHASTASSIRAGSTAGGPSSRSAAFPPACPACCSTRSSACSSTRRCSRWPCRASSRSGASRAGWRAGGGGARPGRDLAWRGRGPCGAADSIRRRGSWCPSCPPWRSAVAARCAAGAGARGPRCSWAGASGRERSGPGTARSCTAIATAPRPSSGRARAPRSGRGCCPDTCSTNRARDRVAAHAGVGGGSRWPRRRRWRTRRVATPRRPRRRGARPLAGGRGSRPRSSTARTGGRDAVRVIGRPRRRASRAGRRGRAAPAVWTTAALGWGPLYEPHRAPEGP